MNHPREPFEQLLDVFDDAFRRVVGEDGFVFDPRIGHVGRPMSVLKRRKCLPKLTAVFRPADGERFIVLWPEDSPIKFVVT